MLNLNRATILGNITRDIEMRNTPNGQSVANFAVATNRRWSDSDGGQKEAVEYHEIVAWGKLAEIASQYAKKGSKVYIEGRLQTRSWEGQDGAKRQRTEIVAENLILLSPKGEGASSYTSESKNAAPTTDKENKKDEPKETKNTPSGTDGDEINLDDIPF